MFRRVEGRHRWLGGTLGGVCHIATTPCFRSAPTVLSHAMVPSPWWWQDVQPVPIRVASCHALRSLCPFVSAAQLEPVMPAAVARVAAFAATATENLLVFVLSTLNVCMKVRAGVC